MARKSPAVKRSPDSEEDSVAAQTMADILAIATEEFALKGLAGARVDEIAERTRTSKRMIYYYFGGKEELYRAVLTKVYADIRTREEQLKLSELSPVEAMRRLVELTFDYDETHVPFIRLVMSENIHRARHLGKLPGLKQISASVKKSLGEIVRRGVADGVFRSSVDPIDLHLFISAFCFFRVSNQHTLKVIFGPELLDTAARKRHKAMIVEAAFNMLGVSANDRA